MLLLKEKGLNPALFSFSESRAVRLLSVCRSFGLLVLLTIASILANGYHYATDDGGLYIPAILQRLNPSLYPFDTQFINAQTHFSAYAFIASGLARCFAGSVVSSVFVLHGLATFLLLAAGLLLADGIFTSRRAVWSAVSILAFTTSIFVAGTSIPIMDPYFTARTLSTPLTLLGVSGLVTRKWLLATCALGLACAVHPLMAGYAAVFAACYWFAGGLRRSNILAALTAVPLFLSVPFILRPLSDTARQTLEMSNRSFFLASRWSALDWAGVAIPLAFYFVLWRTDITATRPLIQRLGAAGLLCGTAATILFFILSFTRGLESSLRLQPMRAFQLLYIVMFLIIGGLLGHFVLLARTWRWAVMLLVLAIMDFAIDHATYPNSNHIEWPNASSGNEWVDAFDWVRLHTAENALFALPPACINTAGEDRHGFRALAQRSALADELKDSGVVSMLPAFAPEWKQQVDAQSGWDSFNPTDFQTLAQRYPVRWVIVEQQQRRGLECPYQNAVVAVCRIAP